MSKGSICYVSRMVMGIRLKISRNVEGQFELNLKALCTSWESKRPICNILGMAKDI
jgi:hypothetical protein